MDSALDSLLKTQPSLWRGRDAGHKCGHGQQSQQETIDTGFPALNNALPGGGWNLGTLTELLFEHEGCGELSLLLPALKTVTQQQQWVALVNPPHIPYAPALSNAGISLDRTLIVDSDNDKDALWATEQLLRAGLFTVVVCWLDKTGLKQQRRLQLAAETGHALAIAYRPTTAAADHSAAAFRLSLSSQAGMKLNVFKSRGGALHELFIQAHDFDTSQGVEWPGQTTDNKPADNDQPGSY